MFYRYKKVLILLSNVFKLMPLSIKLFLWDCSNSFSGKINIGLRYALLKSMVKSCGDNVYIGKNVTIKSFHCIEIGDNVSLHEFSYVDATGGLKIGNNVSMAHNLSILTTSHEWDNQDIPIKYNEISYSPVVIQDDVWIGCAVRILNGVTINNRSVIAAGSIVNKDVPSNTIVAGVPAKIIRNI